MAKADVVQAQLAAMQNAEVEAKTKAIEAAYDAGASEAGSSEDKTPYSQEDLDAARAELQEKLDQFMEDEAIEDEAAEAFKSDITASVESLLAKVKPSMPDVPVR
jgi:predicted transcriptional regulator